VALSVKDPGRRRMASMPLPVPRGDPLLLPGPLSLPPLPLEAPLRTPARAGAAPPPLPLLPPACCVPIAASTTSPKPRPDACRARAGEAPDRPDEVTEPALAALAVLARRSPRAPPPLTTLPVLPLPALSLLDPLTTLPLWSLAHGTPPPPCRS
jgi:hypothetical protein